MNTQQIIEVLSEVIAVNTHGEYTEYVLGDELDPTSYIFHKDVSGRVKFIGSLSHGFSSGWVFNLKDVVESGDLSKVLSSSN